MSDKIKMSNGVAEIEVEITGLPAPALEALAIRLFNEAVPKTSTGQRAGFSGTGWSTTSQVEKGPEDD